MAKTWSKAGRSGEKARSRARRRHQLSRDLFEAQCGVASRRQLYAAGLTRGDLRAEVGAGRWQCRGRQAVSNVTGELGRRAHWWAVVLEAGSGAALDGVTALFAAGLKGYDEPQVHLSMPKSAKPRSLRGVRIHETRRRRPGDVVPAGVPRVRPEIAAVRAALWASTDRQAALLLIMAVQQGCTTADALADAAGSIHRDRRRRLLWAIIGDIRDGVRSLGELDFAKQCRQAGLPEPDRQVLRDLGDGVCYLDCFWDRYDLVAEIDGIHHAEAAHVTKDALRQNEITNQRATVLRIPVVGLRTEPARFLDQVRAALLARGWTPNPGLASEQPA
jgi:hypothetical protein